MGTFAQPCDEGVGRCRHVRQGIASVRGGLHGRWFRRAQCGMHGSSSRRGGIGCGRLRRARRNGTSPKPVPTPGGIFGGTGSTAKPRIPLSNPPTSPLNLIGKLEGWGIGPATPVSEVSIKVSAATGAQLKELLKKLPDGMTFELSLEKEDN